MFTDNPDLDAQNYFEEQERKLEALPKCFCCEEAIQQEAAVQIDGNLYCDECLENMRYPIERE